jgi:hypothetical protein
LDIVFWNFVFPKSLQLIRLTLPEFTIEEGHEIAGFL